MGGLVLGIDHNGVHRDLLAGAESSLDGVCQEESAQTCALSGSVDFQATNYELTHLRSRSANTGLTGGPSSTASAPRYNVAVLINL
jgi:hypothetical protein